MDDSTTTLAALLTDAGGDQIEAFRRWAHGLGHNDKHLRHLGRYVNAQRPEEQARLARDSGELPPHQAAWHLHHVAGDK